MSRLECKDAVKEAVKEVIDIRICPDWNVKGYIEIKVKDPNKIRICPDWNVKPLYIYYIYNYTILEYVQIGM